MKYIILFAVIVLLVGGIAILQSVMTKKTQKESGAALSFQLSAEPQDAVFLAGQGYTGGLGSMPVLDVSGNIQQVDGLPVYVDEAQVKTIVEKGNMPSCVVGKPKIEVAAKIHLEKKEDTNSSIEDAPTVVYYIAKIDELKHVTIDAQKCEE